MRRPSLPPRAGAIRPVCTLDCVPVILNRLSGVIMAGLVPAIHEDGEPAA